MNSKANGINLDETWQVNSFHRKEFFDDIY